MAWPGVTVLGVGATGVWTVWGWVRDEAWLVGHGGWIQSTPGLPLPTSDPCFCRGVAIALEVDLSLLRGFHFPESQDLPMSP